MKNGLKLILYPNLENTLAGNKKIPKNLSTTFSPLAFPLFARSCPGYKEYE
jgi:hypothetical protein